MNCNERVVNLDYLRVFAIISVVVCHATEMTYKLNLEFISELDNLNQISAFLLFTFGRLGVPIFLFLTGYLLLDRTYDDKSILKFWKCNLFSLLITTEIWIVLYNVFLTVLNGTTFNWKLLVKTILFIERVPMGHMWYMPMIIGVYIFIPYVANALKGFSLKSILRPYLLSVVFLMIFPCISIFRLAEKQSVVKSILSLEFSGGVYGLILLGGYIYRRSDYLKNLSNRILVLLIVVFYFSTVGVQLYCYHRGLAYNVWYNNLLLVVCSFAIFIIINKIKFRNGDAPPYYTFVKCIARYSFGIYLVHYPVLMILKRYLTSNALEGALDISILTFVLSFIFVHIVSQCKEVGKIIFYLK